MCNSTETGQYHFSGLILTSLRGSQGAQGRAGAPGALEPPLPSLPGSLASSWPFLSLQPVLGLVLRPHFPPSLVWAKRPPCAPARFLLMWRFLAVHLTRSANSLGPSRIRLCAHWLLASENKVLPLGSRGAAATTRRSLVPCGALLSPMCLLST